MQKLLSGGGISVLHPLWVQHSCRFGQGHTDNVNIRETELGAFLLSTQALGILCACRLQGAKEYVDVGSWLPRSHTRGIIIIMSTSKSEGLWNICCSRPWPCVQCYSSTMGFSALLLQTTLGSWFSEGWSALLLAVSLSRK